MTSMIPYADITAAADRRWTFRLLDRLVTANLPDDELEHLVGALQAVSDPRSLSPLEAVVCDTARPAGIRRAASSVLRGMQYLVPDVPDARLRRWWREGDLLLRRHALLSMDAFDCPDIVIAVASDRAHPLHAQALGQLTFDFDRPEQLDLKIAALAHPDRRVRETAATILFWDEPIRAEGPLLDVTRDPVPEVAAEACKTLQYYPSLRTVSCLHGLLDHPAEKVRQEAEASFRDVRHEFLLGLRSRDRHVARHVRHWLEPVWDMLAFTDHELRPDEEHAGTAPPPEPGEALSLADLLEMLGDPDASPKTIQEALWRRDWRGYAAAEAGQLRRVLLEHPDPLVREEAAVTFEAWQDADGLLALVGDADFGVRKAAMYRLGQFPPTPKIADLAWEHLHRPDALGVHAEETLATFVRHADAAVAVRRLGWIAGDHGHREGLRVAALYHLMRLGAVEELSQLAGLLLEPPEVTWSLHIALLEAVAESGLSRAGLLLEPPEVTWSLHIALLEAVAESGLSRPDIGHLREVDNLHVQEAIAQLQA